MTMNFFELKHSTTKIPGVSIFFFLRIRRKNLKLNNVPVGVVIVLESEGLYSAPRNTGKKQTKKTLHQFVNTPTDSSEPKVSIENRIFRWGSCFLRDVSFSSLQLFHIFPTNFLK